MLSEVTAVTNHHLWPQHSWKGQQPSEIWETIPSWIVSQIQLFLGWFKPYYFEGNHFPNYTLNSCSASHQVSCSAHKVLEYLPVYDPTVKVFNHIHNPSSNVFKRVYYFISVLVLLPPPYPIHVTGGGFVFLVFIRFPFQNLNDTDTSHNPYYCFLTFVLLYLFFVWCESLIFGLNNSLSSNNPF